jgi:hypothetical protein
MVKDETRDTKSQFRLRNSVDTSVNHSLDHSSAKQLNENIESGAITLYIDAGLKNAKNASKTQSRQHIRVVTDEGQNDMIKTHSLVESELGTPDFLLKATGI